MKNTIIGLILFYSTMITGVAPESDNDPLLTFTEIADEHQLSLTNWEVSLKETQIVDDVQTYVNTLRKTYKLTRNQDENSIRYLIEDKFATKESITVQYSIIISKQSPNEIVIVAVIKGDSWSAEIKQNYLTLKENIIKDIFTSKVREFTCIEMIENDTIENRVVIEPFLSSLKLENVNKQYDNVQKTGLKKIIYGYTPLWDEKFILKGEPLNLQIAIIELKNGKKSYKIGTPILINEY